MAPLNPVAKENIKSNFSSFIRIKY